MVGFLFARPEQLCSASAGPGKVERAWAKEESSVDYRCFSPGFQAGSMWMTFNPPLDVEPPWTWPPFSDVGGLPRPGGFRRATRNPGSVGKGSFALEDKFPFETATVSALNVLFSGLGKGGFFPRPPPFRGFFFFFPPPPPPDSHRVVQRFAVIPLHRRAAQ